MVVLNIPTVTPEFAERLDRRKSSQYQDIWALLDSVYDPELPTISIWDLGILQDVKKNDEGYLIEITLTYSGCPAVGVIKEDIQLAFKTADIKEKIRVEVILSPAWTSDLLSPEGRVKLKQINIVAPVDDTSSIGCPICDSQNTQVISEFGSTACKALYRCLDCLEPFDYFKQF